MLCLAEWLTFRTCHLSIATNESYREIALTRGGMDAGDVHVVRSGPSLERLIRQPPVPALRKGRSILIGYVGVIGQQEGIDHLLEALRILIDDLGFSDFHCTICGGGPELEAMRRRCTELGLDDHVEFAGRIPEAQLLAILNTADICVNPDVWNVMNDRSTMNKVMEYMALGKPIVQYELREGRVSAGGASLYARPNDRTDFAARILELVQNPGLRAEMGAIGRERIEKYLNWSVEEPKLLAAYSQLFGLRDR
jgi:glycosyltransferase involved in cell wall biosynthesis